MKLYEGLTSGIILFMALIAKAFAKVMLMLFGVLIAFLTLPQSRVAAMLFISVFSALAGGILIQVHQDTEHWNDAFTLSLAFGAGFMVFPTLAFFKKFNEMLNADSEFINLVYNSLRDFILRTLRVK